MYPAVTTGPDFVDDSRTRMEDLFSMLSEELKKHVKMVSLVFTGDCYSCAYIIKLTYDGEELTIHMTKPGYPGYEFRYIVNNIAKFYHASSIGDHTPDLTPEDIALIHERSGDYEDTSIQKSYLAFLSLKHALPSKSGRCVHLE